MTAREWGLSKLELRRLRALKTPERVQAFLDNQLKYNKAGTCRSVRSTLRAGSAHCLEGALVAAAALRVHGRPCILMDLEAVRDDDHVVALFRERDCWGAIAKSNYSGLRFREPVYRTLRELAISYFEHYYNPKGEKTLRAYSRPVDLARFDSIGWMTGTGDVWPVAEYLVKVKHYPLLHSHQARVRRWIDQRSFAAGFVGAKR